MKKIQLLCVVILIGIFICKVWISEDVSTNTVTEPTEYSPQNTLPRSINVEADTDTGPFELMEVDTPPIPIEVTPPAYPLEAKLGNTEGKVILRFIVTTKGTTRDIEVFVKAPISFTMD